MTDQPVADTPPTHIEVANHREAVCSHDHQTEHPTVLKEQSKKSNPLPSLQRSFGRTHQARRGGVN